MKKSTVILSGLAGFAVFAVAKKISSWVGEQKEFCNEMAEVGARLAQEQHEEELAKEQERQDLKDKVRQLEEELYKYQREERSEELVDFINSERAKAKRDESISKLDDGFKID